jgi:hypothetical protein
LSEDLPSNPPNSLVSPFPDILSPPIIHNPKSCLDIWCISCIKE